MATQALGRTQLARRAVPQPMFKFISLVGRALRALPQGANALPAGVGPLVGWPALRVAQCLQGLSEN